MSRKKKVVRERISIEDLENMTHSKYVQTRKIGITDKGVFGDEKKHILECDIFDGFAYCADHEGSEYWIDFPKVNLYKLATSMAKHVREYMNLSDTDEIKVEHSLASYATIHKNL